MFRKILVITLLWSLLLLRTNAQTMRVATYNIRYDNPGDSLNAWQYRLPIVTDLIKFYDFDIFGIQEGLYSQVADLTANLPAYAYIGVGRDDGKQAGELSAIFYNKTKFELLQQGTFWLAPVTDKPVKGWDAALPRICTWGQFRNKKSGFVFYHFNTHFDHRGVEARKESAKLILNTIKKMAPPNMPVILTGDLNVDQHNESYTLLNNSGVLKDAYEMATVRLAHNGTFNAFNINTKSDSRIDHIFLSHHFRPQKYGILTNSYQARLPSDHFPVMVDVTYQVKK